MNILINVKDVSNRQNKVVKLVYNYPDGEMRLRKFLSETAGITVREYDQNVLQCFEDGLVAVFLAGRMW